MKSRAIASGVITGAGARSGMSLAAVADAAIDGFIDSGFRRTQIADVAARLGISVGAIYRFVDGKETLFHVAALRAAGILPASVTLPFQTADIAATHDALRALIERERRWPVLECALRARYDANDAEAIAAELYDLLARWSTLVRLLERCGRDQPMVAALFETQLRGRYMSDLTRWAAGATARRSDLADTAVLARAAMEALSWLVLRRPNDSTGRAIPEDQARRAAIEIFRAPFVQRAAAR